MDSSILEKELINRAKEGDLKAFEDLIQPYQKPLYAFIYRMVSNPDDAEELCQQTIIRAWEKLPGFKGKSRFKTWLYKIGINLTLNFKTRTPPVEPLNELLPINPANEPEAEFYRRRQENLVREAIAQLPPDQRTALLLSVYENLSYKEIAEVMGKSVRAVDALLVRARNRLRSILQPAREKGVI